MRPCPRCGAAVDGAARFCTSCGGALPETGPGDRWVGKIVAGKFRVEALVGRGGMGRVYRATHLALDRTVALKMLDRSACGDPQLAERFRREARAASRLDHPSSVAVLDFGEAEDGTLFMAMEHVDGRDLARLLAEEFPLGEARVVRIGAQILSALEEAHAKGVVHRDLKPENVMVAPRRGEPDLAKVLDFGIAKIAAPGAGEPRLTVDGLVCGTPEYMSPEQARGQEADPRSDLYSAGVILYQLATGELPFSSDTAVGFLTKHVSERPPPARGRRPGVEVSLALDAVIARALEKDPAARFQSAGEMRAALLACEGPPLPSPLPREAGDRVQGEGANGRWVAPWVVAAVALAVAAGGAVIVAARRSISTPIPTSTATATATATSPSTSPPHPGPLPRFAGERVPGAGERGRGAGETVPGAGETVPGAGERVPGAGERVPGAGERVPGAGERVPGAGERVPGAGERVRGAGERGRGAGERGRGAGERVQGDSARARALLADADARRARQDVDGAIALYLEAEAADPELAEIQKKLGLCYQLKGDARSAAERYRRYLESRPADEDRVRAILSTLR